jgi:hypothetical protein
LPSCAPVEKGSFCPQKERYWPQIGPIINNFSKPVKHLTWPDQAPLPSFDAAQDKFACRRARLAGSRSELPCALGLVPLLNSKFEIRNYSMPHAPCSMLNGLARTCAACPPSSILYLQPRAKCSSNPQLSSPVSPVSAHTPCAMRRHLAWSDHRPTTH